MDDYSDRAAEKQKRARPMLSCAQCHARKIKCDRVKPCGACCLRGAPEQCSLETSDDAQSYISQANEIKRLRKEVSDLEARATREGGSPASSSGPKTILPARPRPSPEHSESGFRSSFNQLRHLCANLSLSSISWAEQPFSPIHALSNIQMAPPSISHMASKAQVDNIKLAMWLDCVSPPSMTGLRNWFRAMVDSSAHSELAGPALHASSNLFFALQTNDHALLRESQRLHVEALANLRMDIGEPNTKMAYHALYATLLLIFYELASFNSPFSWMVHVGGAEKVVKHMGPAAFAHGLPHDTFVLFSFFSFIMRIFQRKRSFLAEPAWRIEPFANPASYNDPFVRLMHIILDIPLLLEQAEIVYAHIDSPSFDPTLSPSTAAPRLWDRVAVVEEHLQRWESEMVRSHEGSPSEGAFGAAGAGASPFRFQPQGEYAGPTLEPATTLCVYYAARLLLAHIDRRPAGGSATPSPRPSPEHAPHKGKGPTSLRTHDSGDSAASGASPASAAQVLRWAVSICSVAADRAPHVRDAVTAVVYLFALRVAYLSFPPLSNGCKWVEGLFDRVALRFGLPLARSILAHLPGPDAPALQDFGG